MKKKIFFSLSVLTVMLILISATDNMKSPCDSPVVGDHSGAPGETNCSGCHSSPVNPNVPDLHFEVEGFTGPYQLDSTYLIHIRIRRPGHTKFGFVCSALDSVNVSTGTFSLVDAIRTRIYTLGGRNYVSHTPCGADAVDSTTWTYKWKAPSSDKGKVKIYMSMLVANHDEALTGDTTYTRILQINSPSTTGIFDQNLNTHLTKVFPTYFSNSYTIDFDPTFSNNLKTVSLYTTNGKLMQKDITKESNFKQEIERELTTGMYILKIDYGIRSESFKLIKQ